MTTVQRISKKITKLDRMGVKYIKKSNILEQKSKKMHDKGREYLDEAQNFKELLHATKKAKKAKN